MKHLHRVYVALRIALLAAVIAYLAARIAAGWPTLRGLELHWSRADALGALVASLAAYPALILGWLVLLRRVGYFESRHLLAYGRIWWLSYLFRYVPGKVLLLVERGRMGRRVGIPAEAGAALAVIETLLAILAGAWVSLLALAFHLEFGAYSLRVVGLLSLAVFWLLPPVYRWLSRLPPVQRRFPALAAVPLRPLDLLATIPFFVLHYLLIGLAFFFCARALGPLGWAALPGLAGVYALSHVAGIVTMLAPGGLGVREGALAVQLGRLFAGGVAEALAVGVRVWFTAIELFSLGIALGVSRPLPEQDEAAPAAVDRS